MCQVATVERLVLELRSPLTRPARERPGIRPHSYRHPRPVYILLLGVLLLPFEYHDIPSHIRCARRTYGDTAAKERNDHFHFVINDSNNSYADHSSSLRYLTYVQFHGSRRACDRLVGLRELRGADKHARTGRGEQID